jgi:hypothetical protein
MRRFPLVVLALLASTPAPLAAQLTMGPEVAVSEQDCYKFAPQVAYNSLRDEYLVVWHDICASGTPASHVYGRRLDRWGKPVGNVFEVGASADGRDRWDAAIAYDSVGDRYLVTYTHDYNGDASDFDIRGRFLAWNGPNPEWSEFSVALTGYDEQGSRVAYSPTSAVYLVVYEREDETLGWVVDGALFAFGVGPTWFNIAVSGLRVDPDVAYDSFFDLFGVAYDDQSDVYVTVVDHEGDVYFPEGMVSSSYRAEAYPAVASCLAQYLVAWDHQWEGADFDVWARFLYVNSQPDGDPFWVAQTYAVERTPRIACLSGGLEYLLVFSEEVDGDDVACGNRYTSTRDSSGMFEIRAPAPGETGIASWPSAAGGRIGWLVAWRHQRQVGTPYSDIHARMVWELFADGFEWGSTASRSARVP